MKKCAYCAEEIQAEAIKCKHCGEWLSVPTSGTNTDQSDTTKKEREEKDRTDSVKKNVGIASALATADIKYQEVPGVFKKPGKCGWGWFIFLGLIVPSSKINFFADYTFSMIWDMLIFASLVPYFELRRRFLKKWGFLGEGPWKAGLVAGICTYILVLAVLTTMIVFDSKSLNSRIAGLDAKYRDRVASFKQEENKYQTKLVSEPQNAKDMKKNAETVNEILAYNKEKHRFFHEMFNDYKETLKDKRRPKADKSWSDSIDQALSFYDKSYEKQTSALLSLKTYYVTGEEKYYENYTATYRDAAQLATEFQKVIKEIFNVR